MRFSPRFNFVRLSHIVIYCALLANAPLLPANDFQDLAEADSALTLVRVNIITETRGAGDAVEINGKTLAKYSPIIIREFPSTGIILDQRNHVMTFLGYRWVDIHGNNPRIIITTREGQKWNGKLLGIDQSNGVAVVKLLEGKLNKTPVCIQCDVKDGVLVMAPIIGNLGKSEYRETQVVSVETGPGSLDPAAWVMRVNRPLPDLGLPILTTDRRVLGFIAGMDPMDMQTVVYPIAQLLSSAEKILKTGGDIRTGWLGVFLSPLDPLEGSGVLVQRVEQNSPAQKAGLVPGDLLTRFDGREIKDAMQFIQLIQNAPIGSKVRLDILRQGRPINNMVALIEARRSSSNRGRFSFNLTGAFDPNTKGFVPELTPRSPRLLMGLGAELLTPPLAEALQMPTQTGLLVVDVASKLPADLAGVLPGDIIVSIDGQPVIDAPGFTSFLLTHAWSSQSVLKVLRKGSERTIVVQLPIR